MAELLNRGLGEEGHAVDVVHDGCNWLDWYRLGEITETFQCRRCLHLNHIELERWREPADEPAWFYDLDHLVREALLQNGRVPLLASEKLRRAAPSSFSAVQGCELTKDGEDSPFAEVDVISLADGRITVTEGKARVDPNRTAMLTSADIGKKLEACRVLTAERFCLATSQPAWSSGTRTAVEAACRAAGIEVLWFQGLG